MTNSGTTIKQRDIVILPFPHSDLSSTKRRPALILSNSKYHSNNQDVICCAITSNPKNYPDSVELQNSDLESGKLKLKSRIKPTKIFTLYKGRIIKVIAKLNFKKSKEVVKNLNILIEIEE